MTNSANRTLMLLSLITTSILLQSNLALTSIPQLAVLVTTNKSAYTYRSIVEISGKLWLSGQLVDGIIGIEITNPNSDTLVVRAVPAGTPTLSNDVEIVAVTPCDQLGNPKDTFKRGTEDAHVNVTVRNNDITSSKNILITVVAYDNDSTPILPQVQYIQTTLPPGGTIQFKPDFPLNPWISTGNAIFYASVFTDWPSNVGIPYTTEKSAKFTVTTSTGTLAITNVNNIETTSLTGIYSLAFRLPPTNETGAPFGNYTIKVSAYSQGYTAQSSTTFTREFQIDGDVNFDHKVDILDIVAITSKYGSKSGDPNWNPEVDIQPSGKIDITDVVTATSKYGQTY